jgi:hypothetical protein
MITIGLEDDIYPVKSWDFPEPRQIRSTEQVFDERAGRRFTLREPDFHGVEPVVDITVIKLREVPVGGVTERLLLGRPDRLGGTAEIVAAPRAHLDEDEHPALAADQVDLAVLGAVVAKKNAVAARAQERGGNALTMRSPRRRR